MKRKILTARRTRKRGKNLYGSSKGSISVSTPFGFPTSIALSWLQTTGSLTSLLVSPALTFVDSLAPQDLFALLPASHRKKFVGALQSEKGRARLLRDAEADETYEDEEHNVGDVDEEEPAAKDDWQGWWAPTGVVLQLDGDEDDEVEPSEQGQDARQDQAVVSEKPNMLDEAVLGKISIPETIVVGLRFNLLAIWSVPLLLLFQKPNEGVR
jgi:hypothetical protein